MRIPKDCVIRELTTHADGRGALTEIFRAEWNAGIEPVQWNFVRSRANVLRGVHVHVRHADYLICLEGSMILALADIRPGSPTHGLSATLELRGDGMQAALVPPGVAHGFYFPQPASFCYAVSHYWNTDDEIGCRWDDPDLKLDWQVHDPLLSRRDAEAGTATRMTEVYLSRAAGLQIAHG